MNKISLVVTGIAFVEKEAIRGLNKAELSVLTREKPMYSLRDAALSCYVLFKAKYFVHTSDTCGTRSGGNIPVWFRKHFHT